MRLGKVFGDAVAFFTDFLGRSLIAIVLLFTGAGLVWAALGGEHHDFLTFFVTLLASAWASTLLVEDIRDRREDAGDASILDLFRRTWREGIRFAWATLLASLAVTLLASILLLAASVFLANPWTGTPALVAVLIPTFYLLARWSLLLPAIAIEHKTTGAAFSRSSELVLHARWRVFVTVLVAMMLGVAATVGFGEAVDRATNGALQFWLGEATNALIYSSFLAAVSTALYYELTRPDETALRGRLPGQVRAAAG